MMGTRLCPLFVLCLTTLLAAAVNETCEADDSLLVQQQSSIRPIRRRDVMERLDELEEQISAAAAQAKKLKEQNAANAADILTLNFGVQGLQGTQSRTTCESFDPKGVALDSMVSGQDRPPMKSGQAAQAFLQNTNGNKCNPCVTWAYDYRVTPPDNWPGALFYIPMLKTPPDVTDVNVGKINDLPSSKQTSPKNAVLTYNEIKEDFGYDGDNTNVCNPNGKPLTDVLDGIHNTPCYIAPGVTGNSSEMLKWLIPHKNCYTNSLTKWNAVAFHFYGTKEDKNAPLDAIWNAYFGMRGIINDLFEFAKNDNRDLWMTEFGLTGDPLPVFQDNLQFMCLALCGMAYDRNISFLNSKGAYVPKVSKYAWYAGFNPPKRAKVANNRLHVTGPPNNLTKLGCVYQNFVPSRDCGEFAKDNALSQSPDGWQTATIESVMGGNGLGPCGDPFKVQPESDIAKACGTYP